MTTDTKRYSQQVVEAMKPVNRALAQGETKIRFSCKVGRHLLRRDMDFTGQTKDESGHDLHQHYLSLLDEALGLDAQELLKVAQCPKCRAWFPSFEERNEHKSDAHAAAWLNHKSQREGMNRPQPSLFIGTANELQQEV